MTAGIGTILLLLVSNVFMTFAWYGNLKLQQMNISTSWPLILIILCSWGLAFFEYCAMIPANRMGSQINGGPFSLMQLKIIQEAISLIVFTAIVALVFKGEPIKWNHIVAFVLIVFAVFFAFLNNDKTETPKDKTEIQATTENQQSPNSETKL
ncbi:MAG: DMT family protein [Bacteroidales bacterium]|nr:DMT family protein [Bacteroidales bacterium]